LMDAAMPEHGQTKGPAMAEPFAQTTNNPEALAGRPDHAQEVDPRWTTKRAPMGRASALSRW